MGVCKKVNVLGGGGGGLECPCLSFILWYVWAVDVVFTIFLAFLSAGITSPLMTMILGTQIPVRTTTGKQEGIEFSVPQCKATEGPCVGRKRVS